MTSVPDGIGITETHVALDQEKPINGLSPWQRRDYRPEISCWREEQGLE